jgi:hypothetical protein
MSIRSKEERCKELLRIAEECKKQGCSLSVRIPSSGVTFEIVDMPTSAMADGLMELCRVPVDGESPKD